MKNIQIIDGAQNCTYSIFAISDEDFRLVFPQDRQDIEFVEDLAKRLGEDHSIFRRLYDHPVQKRDVVGLHGTVFYQLTIKKKFYPTKCEGEMISGL